ncbi:MAG: hypothetical protein H6Q82_1855 [Deltaproteobacteria bacterium]|nr:hypothetical protein [Deltaproteobacteria bacterium]MBP2684184.1 hypothetical protein [Deltaproteobacteria bacterium]MBP2686202.1 hypothetical protein [Deltaproteobacteria bacterium]
MVLIMKGIRPVMVDANPRAHDPRNTRDVERKYRGDPLEAASPRYPFFTPKKEGVCTEFAVCTTPLRDRIESSR